LGKVKVRVETSETAEGVLYAGDRADAPQGEYAQD
jgi:hypothetical protein